MLAERAVGSQPSPEGMTLLIGCVFAGLVFWIVQIEIWTKFTTLVLAVLAVRSTHSVRRGLHFRRGDMAKPVRRYGKAAEEMWQREEMRRLIEKLPRQPSKAELRCERRNALST